MLDTLESSYFDIVLPRDAMHERGLCRYAVSFRLSVRLSVTFVDHVKTNKRIFEIFSPSGNHTILGFPYLTAWRYSDGNPPNGGVECRWRRQKTQFWTNIWLYWTCVYWCLQHIYRITLIGVFLGTHFRINLHQTRTQYSDEGPQHWNAAQFPKKTLSKCGILSPKNSCSHFSSLCQQQICSDVKESINDVTPTSDLSNIEIKYVARTYLA